MPNVGDITSATKIGKYGKRSYVWFVCPKCQIARWKDTYQLKTSKTGGWCKKCVAARQHGETAGNWKGGRYKTEDGYIFVKLQPNDFFYSMADHRGYVLEHRLVMAQSLGRCLQSWEMVHHKGIRHSGIENKSDNLGDNLDLTIWGCHTSDHSKGYRDGYLKGLSDGRLKQIQELNKKIQELKREIK